MMTQEKTTEVGEECPLAQRRAYIMLPLAERRQRLAAQAERMAAYYEQEPEQTERRAWQEGDIVEPSSCLTTTWGNLARQF